MGKRSSAHLSAQKKGKERDHYTCQVCGSKNHTEGHHIFDHAYGGAPDKENIITLCHDCHVSVHKGLIELFKL